MSHLLSARVVMVIVLASAVLSVPAQAAAPPSGLRCGAFSCQYTFTRARTAWIHDRLTATDRTTQAVTQLICVRIPHKLVAGLCAFSAAYLYDKAHTHLEEAVARDGCLVVRARLSLRKAITFGSLPPRDAKCG
ncbi:hypothetical protein ACIBHY_37750 [Nonomuraea sp. NPDC050547]|uniref:hypothetical protein n=1 Tax=Nonomuraea sp. NPDC050547 TaxID=3364368 RepID=UPI0037B4BDA5